jgi:hypothetical protein
MIVNDRDTIRYAGIIVADIEYGEWRCVGVIAQTPSGEVMIRIEQDDALVNSMPLLRSMEEYFNREFQDGKVLFYKRDPDDMESHVEVLKTDDPLFLEKYDAELAEEGKHIRLWNIREHRGDGVLNTIIDNLLGKVRREFVT